MAREIQDLVAVILVDHGFKRRSYGDRLSDHSERMTTVLEELEARWPHDVDLMEFAARIRAELGKPMP